MEAIRIMQMSINAANKLLFTLESLWNIIKYVSKIISMNLMKLISYVFTRMLVSLIILYVGAFIIIAVGNLLKELNIDGFKSRQNISIPIINHVISLDFPKDEVVFLSMVGILSLLLLGLLLMVIFKAENGIVILPFEIDPCDKKYSGKAIAEMFITELKRINRIHMDDPDSKPMWRSGEINLAEIQPKIRENLVLPRINPQINPEGESLTKKIEALGTFGFGSASLPVGNIILLLKQICPGSDPGLIVAGCLQKYGSDLSLVAHMKWRDISWSLRAEKEQSQDISYEDLSSLVTDLSFQIAFEQLKPTMNVRGRIQDLQIGKNDFEIAAKHERPSNWRVFRFFTEAKEALQKYKQTDRDEYIYHAKIYALEAASSQPYFNSPLYLLFNVGIDYLNLEKNDEAEMLARYIVTLRPDSALAWYSWGITLTFMSLDREAIRCYDKALTLKDSVEEHKMMAEIYFMKARSLRNLKRYDEAIYYFASCLHEKINNGYVWGHFGITLEAKGDLLNDNILRDQAEDAYRKAVKECPSFVSVHAALARIYGQKKGKKNYEDIMKRDPDKEKELVQRYSQIGRDQTGYNRACIEICCDNRNRAYELLDIAIDNGQINTEWLEEDPDWKEVRKMKDSRFMELLDKSRSKNKTKEDLNTLIKKVVILKKLDKIEGKNKFFFSKHDINDPKGLASKLISDDPFSNHLMNVSGSDKSKRESIKDLLDYLENAKYPWREFFKNWMFLEKQSKSKEITENLGKLEDELIDLLNMFIIKEDIYCKTNFDREKQELANLKNRKELKKTYAKEIGDPQTLPELCEEIQKRINGNSDRILQARYHAVCGNAEEAITLLKNLLKKGKLSTEEIKFHPDFEFIRNNTEFKKLINKSPKNTRTSFSKE